MRCLSPHPSYSIQVFEGKEQVVVDARGYATSLVLDKPVIANFDRSGLLDHEIEAALSYFNFSGIPEGINPLTRIAVFDTEAYVQRFDASRRDEMLLQINERLRELQPNNPSEFIIVEEPTVGKPWPGYDEDDAEAVLALQERIDPRGTLVEQIRRYEQENQNRPEIVEAMMRIENPDLAEQVFGAELDDEPIVVRS